MLHTYGFKVNISVLEKSSLFQEISLLVCTVINIHDPLVPKKPISDTDSNWIFKETSLKVLKFDESYRIILLCITRLFLDEKLKFLQKFKLNCLNFTNDKFIICTADLYVLWLLFWQRQLYSVQFVKKLLTKLEKERETRAGIESHHYPARGFYWNN